MTDNPQPLSPYCVFDLWNYHKYLIHIKLSLETSSIYHLLNTCNVILLECVHKDELGCVFDMNNVSFLLWQINTKPLWHVEVVLRLRWIYKRLFAAIAIPILIYATRELNRRFPLHRLRDGMMWWKFEGISIIKEQFVARVWLNINSLEIALSGMQQRGVQQTLTLILILNIL